EHGVTPPADIRAKTASKTLVQAGEIFSQLGVSGSAESIADSLKAEIRLQYREKIIAQPGIEDYLSALKNKGLSLCVATATDSKLANECLARLGLLKYFDFLLSCEDIGITKRSPEIYLLSSEKFGQQPCDVAVYEDVPYAAKTAKGAGFYVVGYCDRSCEYPQQELKEWCDEYIVDYSAAAKEI
ncbi:MAG: HAD family phosphatase, partial [Oscillospiraceae bacterium]|nr:HAD family phosphatase [Oscillospiraceae bacterium]